MVSPRTPALGANITVEDSLLEHAAHELDVWDMTCQILEDRLRFEADQVDPRLRVTGHYMKRWRYRLERYTDDDGEDYYHEVATSPGDPQAHGWFVEMVARTHLEED